MTVKKVELATSSKKEARLATRGFATAELVEDAPLTSRGSLALREARQRGTARTALLVLAHCDRAGAAA